MCDSGRAVAPWEGPDSIRPKAVGQHSDEAQGGEEAFQADNALDDDDFSAGISGSCRNTSPIHRVDGAPLVVSVGGRPVAYVCYLAKLDPDGGQGNPDNDWNQVCRYCPSSPVTSEVSAATVGWF
jgi:hypothetical protein